MGWCVKEAGKLCFKCRNCEWKHYGTTNSQRNGVPGSWRGYTKTMRIETCADGGDKQQLESDESKVRDGT